MKTGAEAERLREKPDKKKKKGIKKKKERKKDGRLYATSCYL